MHVAVTNAKYITAHVIWLAFNDGAEGEVDLAQELEGEIFQPLKNIDYFKKFSIRGHTLSWENGADFAPEFLRKKIENEN